MNVEEPECKRPFVLYADLNATESKGWLVHKMLGSGELSAFYGPPGCGKGVIIQDMALHIAAGHEWHGRPVTRGAVVYVALERKKLVERRAIAFRNRYGFEDLPFAVVGGVYDFRLPATARHLADICRQVEEFTTERVVLVIIDTVSRALAGGDENSSKDIGGVITTVARLQELTEAAVLLVHHMPHEVERMRGHGALLGAVDTTVAVARSGAVRTAKVIKSNDGEEGEGIAFTVGSVQISPDGTTAAIAVPQVTTTVGRATKISGNPRERRALQALSEAVITNGRPAPQSFGLPVTTNCVSLDEWRQELHLRDIIESTDKNPRASFKRIKNGMAAKA
ncbi:AAA family ATPase [Bradyrhizobium guangdongense]|uniref:AAA+ ATPase domain-containing protein n=1 Tax=Bradyrhizobium guangdongense TaxID=1325090 RepID=A0A410V7H7_9BRAD|nr:AAA family ATPase [Bradyrhizobium guangdongense]QAU39586.1 hypothetical protein X265_19405 [Bradyrhizobium guangdongense]QOZ60647.1 hypothetical protein XH86_19415 [Bradyrhizobium guangdongense]GGI24129.1 hypothetical protein GCM10010987_27840 [Bradyrhizobium guangdongense]